MAVTLVAAAACSNGDSDTAEAKLPPAKKAEIEKVFASDIERLGMRLTRGARVDAKTRKPSATGTHLAVYVEPLAPYTADDYARRIVAVTKVFVPRSFDTWRGLTSFDVCQEPVQSVDARPEPPPKTQVNMTREAAREVGWKAVDLPQLLTDAKRLGTRALSVYAEPEVRRTPMYQDAMVRAQASATTSPPPPTYSR